MRPVPHVHGADGADLIRTDPYAIAQTLAKTASNYSNCIIFYLNKYNLAINDDKFFEYVYDTYGYPEEDED